MMTQVSKTDLEQTRYLADKARSIGQWEAALAFYSRLPNAESNSAVLLNQAICHFGLGDYIKCLDFATKALAIQPTLWQARLMSAKTLKSLGRKQEWVSQLELLAEKNSDIPEVLVEYATVVMNVYGDAERARLTVKPLLGHPEFAEFASNLQLMSLLYERPKQLSAGALSKLIKGFAKKYLFITDAQRSSSEPEAKQAKTLVDGLNLPAPTAGKKRVGVIGGMFSASPVHFLSINAVREIVAQGHQLVVFSRSTKSDWATKIWKDLAAAWVDCSNLGPVGLESMLREIKLDELFDTAGWTDLDVLKSLASKPAPMQFKWVGGQSCTTGMACFDGFITDDFQTPASTFDLYTERLISLGNHYVTYTPPPYMPKPRERDSSMNLAKMQKHGNGVLAVIANPLKISRPFLSSLKSVMKKMPSGVELRFIDQRYLFAPTRKRIDTILGEDLTPKVRYLTPANHPEFLAEMNAVDLIVDTYPYSGGLTICEARYLQIPVSLFKFDRQLFCERHVLSHLQIA